MLHRATLRFVRVPPAIAVAALLSFGGCARLPLPPAVQKLQMGCRSPNFDSKDENPVAILKTPEVEIMIAENLMTVRELRGGRE